MFKFLKDKLKNTISKISSDIDKEGKEEVVEEAEAEETKEKPAEPKKEEVVEKEEEIEKPEEPKEEEKPVEPVVEKEVPKEEEKKEEAQEKKPEQEKEEEIQEEKKSIFRKILPFGKKKEEKAPEEEKEQPKEEITEKKTEEKVAEKEAPKKEEVIEKPKTEKKPEPEVKKEEKKEEAKEVIVEEKEEKPKEIKEAAEKHEEISEPVPPVVEKQEVKEKTGIFSKLKKAVVTKKINEKQFDEMFWDLELALLENNVAVEVIDKIKDDLKEVLINKAITRNKIEEEIMNSLKSSINDILSSEQVDILAEIKEKKPYVMCFVGINGSGKTTTIAKMAYLLKSHGFSCCLAAADTFRAAAIDQLSIHAEKLGIKIIKHDYGADPAAVAFDAIKHAESKNIDVVLIDTAGRIHSDVNLQDEMKKIIRISKPDMKIFVGESITGNDCVEQAKKFNESIELNGIILSKADVDEKGGAALSISYVTKKPILYLGTGQEYGDLTEFDKEKIIENLGL